MRLRATAQASQQLIAISIGANQSRRRESHPGCHDRTAGDHDGYEFRQQQSQGVGHGRGARFGNLSTILGRVVQNPKTLRRGHPLENKVAHMMTLASEVLAHETPLGGLDEMVLQTFLRELLRSCYIAGVGSLSRHAQHSAYEMQQNNKLTPTVASKQE